MMRNDSGFTFIELMIVIAICGILVAITTPNYLKWRSNNFVNNAARELIVSLQEIKMSAIKDNTTTAITFPTLDGVTVQNDQISGVISFSARGLPIPSAGAWPRTVEVTNGSRTHTISLTLAGALRIN